MKPNDSGVAKWSMLRSTTSVASGRASARRRRAGEVAVADDDEHRALDDLQVLGA